MSKTKFTPGPWRPSPTVHGVRFGAVVSDHPVPGISGAGVVEYYGGHLIAESIAPQNLAMIAAAPEMYEALKPFAATLDEIEGAYAGADVTLWESIFPFRAVTLGDLHRARAAIQRARGETP